jgi:RNA polymerase sigma-70 factor (ECF subfamily)
MTNYYQEIFSFVKKKVLDKSTAEDITQEAFTRVIQNGNNNIIQNKRAFLYRVAKNIIVDQIRKRTKISEVPFNDTTYLDENNKIEDNIIQADQNKHLMQEIENLPRKRKQAFILHIIEGYSRKEVAIMMDISLNAVEQHISRASNQIKKNILNKEGDNIE